MERGEVKIERFESAFLIGNAAGDPHVREIPVYLPPGYATDSMRRFPVVYVLSGFTGRGRKLLNDDPWSPALPDRLDRLMGGGSCEPMIVVMPDALTRFGGSQYLNSSATGRYEDHLVEELVPWVDRTFRTLASRDHRGIAGKSSGGYGALVHAMRHPDVFGAIASHSGDVCFDYCYRPDIPRVCSLLQHAGGLAPFMSAFEAALHKSHDQFTVLNLIGMAASYSANPSAAPFGFDMPFDLESGEFRDDVWARWLAHDPLVLADAHAGALRSLRLVYLDCGTRDEWCLHLGARMLARKFARLGIAHEHLEFDGPHMNVSYRYDVSLPRLGRALAPAPA